MFCCCGNETKDAGDSDKWGLEALHSQISVLTRLPGDKCPRQSAGRDRARLENDNDSDGERRQGAASKARISGWVAPISHEEMMLSRGYGIIVLPSEVVSNSYRPKGFQIEAVSREIEMEVWRVQQALVRSRNSFQWLLAAPVKPPDALCRVAQTAISPVYRHCSSLSVPCYILRTILYNFGLWPNVQIIATEPLLIQSSRNPARPAGYQAIQLCA